ncbi:hypothetical protein [Phaeodactylibacter luteus]|uniref:Uncharacterized protein n=1 Tax=Phaeodactylibacter luteus TaxID=1564516 RepID=A0A5C6RY22_9BACT|nr:hypothetical protein [Phaeodactylibacter luteus]TXB66530.1 hypothetical protein FRY97_04905 [Phaeodactylibacter luteus]
MFNLQKDHLFSLVKSLNKAEKRNFRLYVNRLQADAKFVQLFDVLDKMQAYDDQQVLQQLEGVEKKHLPNLKRHLYRQLLTSLRLIYIQKDVEISIHEQIDFARILYGKGMYMQALKILESTKRKALDHHQDILHLEIIEFQKMIEARHITRSRRIENKMEALLDEARQRSRIAHSSNLFSNFNIQVHGWYIQFGHIKSEAELHAVNQFFQEQMPQEFLNSQLTFFEKANLYQAYMWYHYILLDFEGAARHANRWIELFQENEQMCEKDPTLYMRAMYYLMVQYYLTQRTEDFSRQLKAFETFYRHILPQLNDNGKLTATIYLNLSQLNHIFLTQDYERGVSLIPGIKKELMAMGANTDVHRILLFYFKFAYLYFCRREYEKALDYLNEIIHLKANSLRDDLLHNTRMLHLICHYELGNYRLLDYLIPAVQRLFDKATDLSPLLLKTLAFIKELMAKPPAEHPAHFRSFLHAIAEKASSPYERKTNNYLDVSKWLLSHARAADMPQP